MNHYYYYPNRLKVLYLFFLKGNKNFYADVWWKDKVVSFLDCMPIIWKSFPEKFAGNKVPFIADIVAQTNAGLSRAVRIAIRKEYERDSIVKFRQIGLETQLSRLFVDLAVSIEYLKQSDQQNILFAEAERLRKRQYHAYIQRHPFHKQSLISALGILLQESSIDSQARKKMLQKIILEGGPGQGKSTITQMAIQIHRQQLLGETILDPENRWNPPKRVRLPFRIELREFTEWLNQHPDSSVEQFLAKNLNKNSGSDQVSAEHIHNMVEGTSIFLVFDGLDEIGNDEWRDIALIKIKDCIDTLIHLKEI